MPAQVAHRKKAAFLKAFQEVGVVSYAARAAKIGRRTHYDWLESDPEYARKVEDAKDEAADALEVELFRRALDTKKLDTTALIVGLKITGRFVERREFSGPGGGPMQIQAMTPEDRLIAARIVNRQLDTDTPRPQLNGSTNASADS